MIRNPTRERPSIAKSIIGAALSLGSSDEGRQAWRIMDMLNRVPQGSAQDGALYSQRYRPSYWRGKQRRAGR